jgi:threonine dehydratase
VLIGDAAIDEAAARLAPLVVRTPMLPCAALSELLGADVHLKAELFQHTGSFKVRGALNRTMSLAPDELACGLIAFSAGNHAMAVAAAGKQLGVPVIVCMPAGAVQFKIDAVRALGADLELVDGDLVARAMERQRSSGATLVHPFDHPATVAGTATIGREIIADLEDLDTVIVPVGGGGLISGVAAAIKRARPGVRVVGVEPEGADVVARSRRAGHPVALPKPVSLADGLGAPVTGELLMEHIDAYVDELVTIAEAAVAPAWHDLLTVAKLAGEPAAAVGIAAIRSGVVTVRADERVCLLISGGNADFDRLR